MAAGNRVGELRRQALEKLQEFEVLMRNGHFDYGNGYHGRIYLNPHQLFRHPSTIWRLGQDLLDVLPSDLLEKTEVVAGPVTGGALLAHTLAGLLDGRRALTHPPCSFAPFTYRPVSDGDAEFSQLRRGAADLSAGARSAKVEARVDQVREDAGTDRFVLRSFYANEMAGKRVMLADDVRNTGKTYQQCADLVKQAGGTVLATVQICDRMEAVVNLDVPNYALVEYEAPENYATAECPMCRAGEPITTF